MSAGADGPVIGEGNDAGATSGAMIEQLRSVAEEAIAIAREGSQQKEAELWARYRELTRGRRERRKG